MGWEELLQIAMALATQAIKYGGDIVEAQASNDQARLDQIRSRLDAAADALAPKD